MNKHHKLQDDENRTLLRVTFRSLFFENSFEKNKFQH